MSNVSGKNKTLDDEKLVGSDRVLAVLVHLARYPDGISLDDMAKAVSSAKPTVHRALASLRKAGLAIQDSRGRYLLGDEFLRMAFAHHEARPDHLRVQPILERLVDRYGETAHYAVLDGYDIVYRAKVDPAVGAMKLSSTIGGRNPAHATAVGKLLLAQRLPDLESVEDWIGDRRLESRTDRTTATAEGLHASLSAVRHLGYAVDDQENERGVNCIALPAPTVLNGAISISAIAFRMPLQALIDAVPAMQQIIASSPGEPVS